MNVLDRAINFVAPRYGLRRTQARMALELTEGYLERHASRFSYDGASAGRRAYGWYAPSTDANVELMGSLVWLRNRSRDLIRNNPYASKAIEELAGNTVGTGIVPQAKTGDAGLDRIIDAEWPYFVENCDTPQRLDFYCMQSLIMRTAAESGEANLRFRPRLAKDNLRVPLLPLALTFAQNRRVERKAKPLRGLAFITKNYEHFAQQSRIGTNRCSSPGDATLVH